MDSIKREAGRASSYPRQGASGIAASALWGVAEMPFLAFSSPSQGPFDVEAGWGEQDPSLSSSAAASGAGAVGRIS